MADILLQKPAAGTTTTLTPQAEDRLVFEFDSAEATLTRDGENLIMSFEDGSSVNLENFYEAYTSENMPTFLIGGAEVDGESFFAALGEELMPAAGPATGTPQGSGSSVDTLSGTLFGGIDRLEGLDQAYVDSLEVDFAQDANADENLDPTIHGFLAISDSSLFVNESGVGRDDAGFTSDTPNMEYDGDLTTTGRVIATDPNGDTLNYTVSDGAGAYGTFTIDPDTGEFTYVLDDSKANSLGQGETREESFIITVSDGNGGTAQGIVTVVVNGTNDRPTLELVGAASGDDNGFTEFTISGDATAQYASTEDDGMTIKGQIQGYDDDSSDVGYEDGGQGMNLTYFASTQVQHDILKGTDDVNGYDDARLETQSLTNSVNGDYGTLTIAADGTFTYTQQAKPEGVELGVDGQFYYTNGNPADAALDRYNKLQALDTDSAKGEEKLVVYVQDSNGAWRAQEVTINISGVNDAPEIINPGEDDNFLTLVVTEKGVGDGNKDEHSDTPNAAFDNTHSHGGKIIAADVDGDALSYSVSKDGDAFNANEGSVKGQYGTFKIDAEGNYKYTLNEKKANSLDEGDTASESFTIWVWDGNAYAEQKITVDITGTNDRPTLKIKDATLDVTEDSNVSDTAKAKGKDKDDDADLDYFVSDSVKFDELNGDNNDSSEDDKPLQGLSNTIEGEYGTFSVGVNGKFTYTLFDANHDKYENVQKLGDNDTPTETFYVYVKDEHGAWVAKPVTVNVKGVNDASIIVPSEGDSIILETSDAHLEGGSAQTASKTSTASGSFSFSDEEGMEGGSLTINFGTSQASISFDTDGNPTITKAKVDGMYGDLTITDVAGPDVNGKYTVSYDYVQDSALGHDTPDGKPGGTDESKLGDSFEIFITDREGAETNGNSIDVIITDDGPRISHSDISATQTRPSDSGIVLENDGILSGKLDYSFGGDQEGAKLTLNGVESTTSGTSLIFALTEGKLTLNQDGTFTFDPADSFTGKLDLTFTATDGDLDAKSTTISFEVVADNKPTGIPDTGDVDHIMVEGTIGTGLQDLGVNFKGEGGTITITDGTNTVTLTVGTDGKASFADGSATSLDGKYGNLTVSVDTKGNVKYEYEPDTSVKHDATGLDGENATESFTVKVEDTSGDIASGSIDVNVTDTVPTISSTLTGAVSGTFDEANNKATIETDGTVSGKLEISEGADEVTSLTVNGKSVDLTNGVPTSGTVITLDNNQGTVTFGENGAYTYAPGTFLGDVSLKFEATDSDNDPSDTTETIHVDENKIPSFTTPTAGSGNVELEEGGNTSAAEELNVDFKKEAGTIVIGTGANAITIEVTADGTASFAADSATSIDGKYGNLTVSINAEGKIIYTYTSDASVDHRNPLNGEDAIETFPMKATDATGDFANGNINVNVTDDVPVVSSVSDAENTDGDPNTSEATVTDNVASATISVDFGADGANQIIVTGAATDSLTATWNPNEQKWEGPLVEHTPGSSTLEVGDVTLEMGADGQWTVSYSVSGDGTRDVKLDFVDGDGDKASHTVVASAPTINIVTESVTVEEKALLTGTENALGTESVTGTVTITSADGYKDDSFESGFEWNMDSGVPVGADGKAIDLKTSDGDVPLQWESNGTSLIGYIGTKGEADYKEVITVVMGEPGANGNATYTVTLKEAVEHNLPEPNPGADHNTDLDGTTNDDTATDLNFGFTITDGDGDTVNSEITVNIEDDVIELESNVSASSGDDYFSTGKLDFTGDFGSTSNVKLPDDYPLGGLIFTAGTFNYNKDENSKEIGLSESSSQDVVLYKPTTGGYTNGIGIGTPGVTGLNGEISHNEKTDISEALIIDLPAGEIAYSFSIDISCITTAKEAGYDPNQTDGGDNYKPDLVDKGWIILYLDGKEVDRIEIKGTPGTGIENYGQAHVSTGFDRIVVVPADNDHSGSLTSEFVVSGLEITTPEGVIKAYEGNLEATGADGVENYGLDTTQKISVDGVELTITKDAKTGEYVAADEGGKTYFTVVIDANGKWVMHQYEQMIGTVELPFTATDNDGDMATVDVEIQFNTAPTLDLGENAPLTTYDAADDSRDANADADGKANTASGSFKVTDVDGDTLTIFINNTEITKFDGTQSIETALGKVTITDIKDGVVSYTYEQTSPGDHTAGDDSVKDEFTITVSDGKGGEDSDTVTVSIKDDGPEILSEVDSDGNVDLTFDKDSSSLNGSVQFDFGADDDGKSITIGEYKATWSETTGKWTVAQNGKDVATFEKGDSIEFGSITLTPEADNTWKIENANIGTEVTITDGDGDEASFTLDAKGELVTDETGANMVFVVDLSKSTTDDADYLAGVAKNIAAALDKINKSNPDELNVELVLFGSNSVSFDLTDYSEQAILDTLKSYDNTLGEGSNLTSAVNKATDIVKDFEGENNFPTNVVIFSDGGTTQDQFTNVTFDDIKGDFYDKNVYDIRFDISSKDVGDVWLAKGDLFNQVGHTGMGTTKEDYVLRIEKGENGEYVVVAETASLADITGNTATFENIAGDGYGGLTYDIQFDLTGREPKEGESWIAKGELFNDVGNTSMGETLSEYELTYVKGPDGELVLHAALAPQKADVDSNNIARFDDILVDGYDKNVYDIEFDVTGKNVGDTWTTKGDLYNQVGNTSMGQTLTEYVLTLKQDANGDTYVEVKKDDTASTETVEKVDIPKTAKFGDIPADGYDTGGFEILFDISDKQPGQTWVAHGVAADSTIFDRTNTTKYKYELTLEVDAKGNLVLYATALNADGSPRGKTVSTPQFSDAHISTFDQVSGTKWDSHTDNTAASKENAESALKELENELGADDKLVIMGGGSLILPTDAIKNPENFDDLQVGNSVDLEGTDRDDVLVGGMTLEEVQAATGSSDAETIIEEAQKDPAAFVEKLENSKVEDKQDDILNGNDGDDILIGLGGDDTLNGGDGEDIFFGGSGNDTIFFDLSDKAVHGGSGNDLFVLKEVENVNINDVLTVEGGEGLDVLLANVNALKDLGGKLSNVEVIVLGDDVQEASNVQTALTGMLAENKDDVLDAKQIETAGWSQGNTTQIGETDYREYTKDDVTILIESTKLTNM